MIDLQEEDKPVKAFLVGELSTDLISSLKFSNISGIGTSSLETSSIETTEEDFCLAELSGLVTTLGLEICGKLVLKNRTLTAQFGLGTGKTNEIIESAKAMEADCIIFDFELSPSQQRNWEKLGKLPVFDRQEVILRIFASRAKTKEAVLQVELAKLNYALPRLAHTYGDMARQRGGSYGSKGSGETQLELDRRGIQGKIEKLKVELEKVIKERETNRKRREKIPLPTCALVGYTNAGKSSLLNALTGSKVFVEDKLFATLDPTTRRLAIPGSSGILLTDTVGFISNLPHSLVDAFKSTLEEASRANLLLIVLDASDENAPKHFQVVTDVLKEIGADCTKSIIVLNKMDIAGNNPSFHHENAICVSAKDKIGFTELSIKIIEKLFGKKHSLIIPYDKNPQDILQKIRQSGVLEDSQWLEDGVYVSARLNIQLKAQIDKILN